MVPTAEDTHEVQAAVLHEESLHELININEKAKGGLWALGCYGRFVRVDILLLFTCITSA